MRATLDKQDDKSSKTKEIVKLGDWIVINTKANNIICMVIHTSKGYNLVGLDGHLLLNCSMESLQSVNKSLDQDNNNWQFIELRYTFKEI